MNEQELSDWKLMWELNELVHEEEAKLVSKATTWLLLGFAIVFIILKLGSSQTS